MEEFTLGNMLRSIISSFINVDEPLIAGSIIIGSLSFFGALLWFRKDGNKKKSTTNNRGTALKESKRENSNDASAQMKSDTSSAVDGKHPQQLRNVFSVKQQPINTGTNGSNKKASSDRPFESSYYFAHNKHSTGGGYSDGLKAEDYVMNGPKLLSKGGVRIDEDAKSNINDITNDTSENAQEKTTSTTVEERRPKQEPAKLTASTPITKYMWDDDGSTNIAKIHIDTLPLTSTETIKWENAGIIKSQVDVRLIGNNNEGLYISIISSSSSQEGGEKRYHLHVPKMYGEATSVKSIVKKHKLLVKITKKRIPKFSNRYKNANEGGIMWNATMNAIGKLTGSSDSNDDDYVSVAWPRLSASSVGGLGGGTTDIDETLFKQEVVDGSN